MRPIDGDAMIEDVNNLWDHKTVDGITASTVLKQIVSDIKNQPTIDTFHSDVLTELLKDVGISLVKEAYLVLNEDRFMTEEERNFVVDRAVLHFHEKGFLYQAVGSFKDSPRRIVYDEDFGCMWYNAEGPEE